MAKYKIYNLFILKILNNIYAFNYFIIPNYKFRFAILRIIY